MYAAATMDTTPPTPGYQERARIALAAAMYYRGIDREQLAAAVGVSLETVHRWLRGTTSMSAEKAAAVTAALDAPDELFVRPPATRERTLAMMAAYDEARA